MAVFKGSKSSGKNLAFHSGHAAKAFSSKRNAGHAEHASKAFGSAKKSSTGSGKVGC